MKLLLFQTETFGRNSWRNVKLLRSSCGIEAVVLLCLQEASLCCLMKLAAAEGANPLLDLDWSQHYSFPRELILVGQLLREAEGTCAGTCGRGLSALTLCVAHG